MAAATTTTVLAGPADDQAAMPISPAASFGASFMHRANEIRPTENPSAVSSREAAEKPEHLTLKTFSSFLLSPEMDADPGRA